MSFLSVAVLGATGNVGQLVIEQLSSSSLYAIVAVSRRKPSENTSVTHRYANYDDIDSLRTAFLGLDVVIFPGSDGDPDEAFTHHQNVIAAVSSANIKRLIYLSTLGANPDSPFTYASLHGKTESLLKSATFDVQIVRASIYAEFFLAAFVKPALATQKLEIPIQSGTMSLVSRVDVADALVRALQAESTGRITFATGPEAMSFDEIANHVTNATKQPLAVMPIGEAMYRKSLENIGMAQCYIDAFTTMLTFAIPQGDFAFVDASMHEGEKERRRRTFAECVSLFI